jgi:site-specific DNA-cytosine methylase
MAGKPLSALDLFTGIGGVCVGLKGIVHPTLHCEIYEPCKAVLIARMEDGTIPECPVAGDIKELTFERKEQGVKNKVEIILSLWPCTGLFQFGKRLGFQNEQSGLFFELMRLIDEIHPPATFLKNVPNVLNMVMHDVVKEISVHRGYDMRWAVVPAWR